MEKKALRNGKNLKKKAWKLNHNSPNSCCHLRNFSPFILIKPNEAQENVLGLNFKACPLGENVFFLIVYFCIDFFTTVF